MSNHDDNTIGMPNPGGRRGASEGSEETQIAGVDFARRVRARLDATQPLCLDSLENPLLAAANDILIFVGSAAVIAPGTTAEQLRQDIEDKLLAFESLAVQAGESREAAVTARYLLCCLVDEIVLTTPWGNDSQWAQLTLLAKLHNETWGGEKFFLLAGKLLQQPGQNINLLELIYVCLSLGFAGKYRIAKDNGATLSNINQQLVAAISEVRRGENSPLSPAWQGVTEAGGEAFRYQSPYLLFSLMLIILAIGYFSFFFLLRGQVEPVYRHLSDVAWQELISWEKQQAPDNERATEVGRETGERGNSGAVLDNVRGLFAQDIRQGLVSVDVTQGFVVIRLKHAALFASGSLQPDSQFLPEKLAFKALLDGYQGSVLVVGHTDSTGKADSNWSISLSRANAVKTWLTSLMDRPGRIYARGVADSQPLVANTSDENRSRNRRVEVMLLVKGLTSWRK
ncbi:type IVB secretion system protein IcmH/DotU [Thalassomonas actiniarum]|uniref:DotU family type IV/VI secretion system protein n=1 Tax=Thalassomonas actiniarum TaxID=485447 RepID=A0AAF0C1G5_9GAMM|nr:type IVB secretion system protein IcmH/DotU [Thalassomonas actiniarum]WDD96699.1 DotU family type IV/VI secretion system protein [Thalassomonas actiniarum]